MSLSYDMRTFLQIKHYLLLHIALNCYQSNLTFSQKHHLICYMLLQVRNVDIPMLDPYREEMLDKNFNTFSFGGHLNFEAYVQYQEYCGFTKAMDALRGMKLMLKGDDGKAVACNIKVKK